MRYVTLQYVEDTEGNVGLHVKGVPFINYPMAATEGLLVAHDLLEHQNGLNAIGSIGDEIEALGGVWFIRGHFGDLRRDGRGSTYSPEEALASDIINMGVMFIENDIPLRVKVPNTRSHIEDDAFNEIIRYAREGIPKELDSTVDEDSLSTYLDATLHLLRVGHRKAEKRFSSATEANTMFWNIANEVDDILKMCEFEGQEFTLGYSANRTYSKEKGYDYY